MARKLKPSLRLGKAEAIKRLGVVWELVSQNISTGQHIRSVIQASEKVIDAKKPSLDDELARVYFTINFSLISSLALITAKLLEEPRKYDSYRQAHWFNNSDKASLPVLIRLVKQRRCRHHLVGLSLAWPEPFEDSKGYWRESVESALDQAQSLYSDFRKDKSNNRKISHIKEIRDRALAHSLFREQKNPYPSNSEVFQMFSSAERIAENLAFAIDGKGEGYYSNEIDLYNEIGEKFWINALTIRQ